MPIELADRLWPGGGSMCGAWWRVLGMGSGNRLCRQPGARGLLRTPVGTARAACPLVPRIFLDGRRTGHEDARPLRPLALRAAVERGDAPVLPPLGRRAA